MRSLVALVLALVAGTSPSIHGGSRVGLSGPAPESLDAGTLGLAVESRVYVDEDRELLVENRGELPLEVVFTAAGGWTIEPDRLVVAPGELSRVVVAGDGADGSIVEIRATGTDPIPDDSVRSALALTALVYRERPFDPWPIVMAVGFLTIAAVTAGVVVWRGRPYRRLVR